MAVKGGVRFRLLKRESVLEAMGTENESLPEDGRELVSNLLGEFPAVKLVFSLKKQLKDARHKLGEYYKEKTGSQYFEKYNGLLRFGYLIPLLTLAASTTAIMMRDSADGVLAITLPILFVMFGFPYTLALFAGGSNKHSIPHGSKYRWKRATKGSDTCCTSCVAAFFGIWIPLALFLIRPHGFAPTYLLPIAISWVLYFKAKKMFSHYSESGRILMEKIEGFKHFLADQPSGRDVVGLQPYISTSLFEEYLPYALALGVGVSWAERFAASNPEAATAYSPSWYIQEKSEVSNAVDFAYYLTAVLQIQLNRISNTKHASGDDWQCTEEELKG